MKTANGVVDLTLDLECGNVPSLCNLLVCTKGSHLEAGIVLPDVLQEAVADWCLVIKEGLEGL